MATTRLMPLHTGKGQSVAAALGRTTDYVGNPDKTDGGEWVSAYECDPTIADSEFLYSKRQYAALTGRDQGERDVIAYHLRQSFRPGETDPATAKKIGYELAMALTKGKHAFIVCTHVDKAHVHSHIIFNSTSLDRTRKFKNFWNSSFAIRKISDRLCLEHGLSIIENPRPSRGHYGQWMDGGKPPTLRDGLWGCIRQGTRGARACKNVKKRCVNFVSALYGCVSFDHFSGNGRTCCHRVYARVYDYCTANVPVLNLLGIPEASAVAPSFLTGFADILLPFLAATSIESQLSKFIICIVSTIQVICMSETGVILLKSKIPVKFSTLLFVFLEKTVIAVAIALVMGRLIGLS